MGFLLPSTPNTRTEGPRLNSLEVTDSAYGNDIPIAFGTVRLGGNIIWSTEIKEERAVDVQRTGGKGGGGSTQTTVNYLYYVSFAVAFAEGIGTDVLRIWADGKIIHDQKAGSLSGTRDGINFRFYSGSETQLPDSLIEQDKGDEAPAHRGLCYIVFDNLPLTNFGNRIPSITAEINFESVQTEVITTESESLSTSVRGDAITADYNRDRIYVEAQSETAIYALSLSTMQVIQELPFFNIYGVNRLSGLLFGSSGTDDVIVNPFSGGIEFSIRRSGGNRNSLGAGGVGISLVEDVGTSSAIITRDTDSAVPVFRYHDGGNLSELGVLSAPDGTYEHVTLSEGPPGTGLALGGFWNSNQLLIYKFQVEGGAFGEASADVTASLIATITPDQVSSGAATFNLPGGSSVYSALDATTNSLVFGIGTNNGSRLVKIGIDGVIDWTTSVPFVRVNTTAESDTRLSGGAWAYHNGSKIVRVNLATGALDEQLDGTTNFPNLGDDSVFFDDNRNAIYNFSNSFAAREFHRHLLGGRSGTDVRVADIIDRLSERVGIEPVADSDVSLISDTVNGYIIDRRSTVKSSLQPLAELFFFDVIERDGKLVYQGRGGTSAATIPEDNFIRTTADRSEQYIETRIQEAELPLELNLLYIDADNDFQQNTASVRRIRNPSPAVLSDNRDEVEIPAVITSRKAKQTAESLLYTRWLERSSYKVRLPWTYLYLDPSDATTFNLNNGFSFRGRLDTFDIGVDYTAELDIVRENVGQYISTVESDGGSVVSPQLPTIGPTQLFLLDTPLLQDGDDTNNNGSRAYWAAANFGEGIWPGARLFKSQDGAAWVNIGQENNAVPWGVTSNALPDPGGDIWRFDRTSTLAVSMVNNPDALESVTETQVLNGQNAALLIKSNGEVELIQFATVTTTGEHTFELDTLLRGRRGTDAMATGHSANEFFLLLTPAVIETLLIPISDLNTSFRYRPPTVGQVFEQSLISTFTFTGRDVKPYAPVNYTATLNGVDVDISWMRRTRLGGEFKDGTGTVPLAEVTEEYDLEILDGPSGNVVRTASDLTSPGYTYTQADRAADGLGTAGELTLRAYQKSAQVGRGFTVENTVEII